ncbi:MAG: anthranilate synthase component I [Chloroflexi bacterium]|nr:anthranilate synthase component I [Chloroflexota bacterium]
MAFAPSLTRERADIVPRRDEALDLFQQGDLLPVYRRLLADLETPVSVYLKLRQAGQPAFLLESVEGGEQVGRYSFLGVNPRVVITVKNGVATRVEGGQATRTPLAPGADPLHAIKAEFEAVKPIRLPGLPRFVGGAVGFVSYDAVRYFERLPETAAHDLDVPDLAFMIPDTLVIFDHAKRTLMVLTNAHNSGNPEAAYQDAVRRIDQIVAALGRAVPNVPVLTDAASTPPVSNVTQEEFEARVIAAKEYIAAGDAFQIVLSQRLSQTTAASPITIYRALRASNPSPYMFLLDFGSDFVLMGASPEMLVRLEDGIATTRPIAGTRPRGRTEAEDDAYAEELMADPKELAEHVMLVDLGRNDIGRVSEYGSVKVTRMMEVERYSHVMHIVSQVEGRVRPGADAFDLLRAVFPAGTLSGAPKVRAMEIIEELEGTRRGTYGGAVGYFSYDGSMDTCITIRSLLMQGSQVHLQVGAGLVADSDPAREYEETLNKGKALAEAIRFAERGLM